MAAMAATGLVLAAVPAALGTNAAGGSTVRTTLSGMCRETDKLDPNGALESSTIACTGKASCKCGGAAELTYTSTATEPGTGADGHETGTIVASGPLGTVTLRLAGKHTSLGGGTGVWTLVKSTGFKGVTLTRKGSYTTQTHTVSHVTGSMDTIVHISASVGCWRC